MNAQRQEILRLAKAGEIATAQRRCHEIIERHPRARAPHLWLARIATDAGQAAEASRHLQAGAELGANTLAVAKLRWGIARQSADAPAQLHALDELLALEPDDPRWWREALRVQAKTGRDRAAFRSLARLLALSPEAAITGPLQVLAARLDPEAIDEALSPLVEASPGNWSLRVARAQALARGGRATRAWDDIEAACVIDPSATFPPGLQHAIETCISRDDRHLATLEALFEAHPRAAGLFWSLAIVLDIQGEHDRVGSLVRANWAWAKHCKLPALPHLWAHLEPSAEIADSVPGARYHELLMRNRIGDALGIAPEAARPLLRQVQALRDAAHGVLQPCRSPGEVTVAGADRPNGTVLVFTGLRDQMAMPVHLIDAFFAALGIKAVYLRDHSRLAFLNGLQTFGSSIGDTIEALSREVTAAGPDKPVYTLGNSAGGMAAIVYAQALRAKATLLFSPPSTLDPELTERMGDQRARLWFRRFHRHVDHRAFELGEVLAGTPEDYVATVFAGMESVEDKAHAERLARMPRTRVRLLEGVADHGSLTHVAARSDLLQVIAEAYSIVPRLESSAVGETRGGS